MGQKFQLKVAKSTIMHGFQTAALVNSSSLVQRGSSKADFDVFAKLLEDGLEGREEARHFLGVRLQVMTIS